MILVIDFGNSRMKWGLHGPRGWVAQGAVANAELAHARAARLAEPAASRRARSASTSPAKPRACASKASSRAGACPWSGCTASAEAAGVTNRYEQARATRRRPLGVAGRGAAARAVASELFPPPCVVVNAGTAVTVDALDADGVFRGGLILPGIAADAARARGQHGGAQGAARPVPRISDEHAGRASIPAPCRRSAARSSSCA